MTATKMTAPAAATKLIADAHSAGYKTRVEATEGTYSVTIGGKVNSAAIGTIIWSKQVTETSATTIKGVRNVEAVGVRVSVVNGTTEAGRYFEGRTVKKIRESLGL